MRIIDFYFWKRLLHTSRANTSEVMGSNQAGCSFFLLFQALINASLIRSVNDIDVPWKMDAWRSLGWTQPNLNNQKIKPIKIRTSFARLWFRSISSLGINATSSLIATMQRNLCAITELVPFNYRWLVADLFVTVLPQKVPLLSPDLKNAFAAFLEHKNL